MINKAKNWLSKLFGIDISLHLNHGFWSTIPLVLEGALATLLNIVLTHLIPQSDFGEYKFILSIIFIAGMASLPSISAALTQSVSKGYESLHQSVKYRLLVSLIGSLGLVFFAGYMHFIRHSSSAWLYLMAAIIFPVLFSYKGINMYVIGKGDYKAGCWYESFRVLIRYVPIFIAAFFFRSLNVLVPVTFVFIALSGIIPFIYMKKKHVKPGPEDKGLWKYGLHLSIMNILPTLSENIDKIIMAAVLGYDQVAVWAIAIGFGELLYQLRRPLQMVFLPKFTVANPEFTYGWIKKKAWVMMGAGIIIAGIFALILGFVMKWIFPASYASSILPAQIITFAFSNFLINEVLASFLVSQKSTASLYKLIFISHGLTIAGFIILIPLLKFTGAIISLFVSNFFYFGYAWYLSHKEVQKICRDNNKQLPSSS
jgi:O-antigen/teichoic acid export membrane protein